MIDITRHREVFNTEKFTDEVHVIGVGATGSFLALALAKMGVRDIHVWDFDKVEEHNIANQAYSLHDIGNLKVDALYRLIAKTTNIQITVHNEAFTNQPISGYVFLMVDSMAARKSIWEDALKLKPRIKHVIEPRMGVDVGRIYNINPLSLPQIKGYEDTFYGDDVAEVSSCGTSLTIITSAMTIAAWCGRQLIEVANHREVDNEILFDFQNNNIFTTRWLD